MPAFLQALGLAAVAFLASALIGRDQRRAGAPSIYVLAGVLIGPIGLGLLDDAAQSLLRPVLSLCIAWIGWLGGLRLFDSRTARPGWRVGTAALVETGVVLLLVTVGTQAGAGWFRVSLSWSCSLAVGIAVAASSHFAVEVFRSRLRGVRPAFLFLEAVSNVDALVALLGLALLGLCMPASHLASSLCSTPWLSVPVCLGLGLAAGVILLLAAGRDATLERGWLVLLGTLFLVAGAAAQLGVPEILVGVVAGAVMARSAGGRRLADAVAPSERPVALLTALLVGTRLGPEPTLLLLALLVVVLRSAGKLAGGAIFGRLGPRGRNLGLGLLSYGGFALAIAAQIDVLYGGFLGALTLTSAAGLCLVGDTLGTVALLSTLRDHGELNIAEPGHG